MKFLGRKKEIERIKNEIVADEMRTVLIYGRRRVGKSALVKKVIEESESKSIYYECKQVTEMTLNQLQKAML